jgi:hypothetical protein
VASFGEIGFRVERRLEELLEESTRFSAALEALGGEDARASRGLHAGWITKPAVSGVARRPAESTLGASERCMSAQERRL